MQNDIQGNWSREQIASALRLVASGVPVNDLLQMMGTTGQIFSAWQAEYAESFNFFVTPDSNASSAGPDGRNVRRTAYMWDGLDEQNIEEVLTQCKIKYRVCDRLPSVVRELLMSGERLANFQYLLPPGSSSRPATSCMALVSAQVVDDTSDQTPFWGACSAQIDELRFKHLKPDGYAEEAVIREVPLKFALEGIFEQAIDAIRAFYTSPIDSLLLGTFLVQKTEGDKPIQGGA